MKIQQSTDVQVTNVQKQDNISKNDVGTSKGSDKGTIKSISGTELTGESIIVQRRKLARKMAFRVVADAFDNEMKIDERLRAIKENIQKISDEIGENNREIAESYETLKKLQEELHVDPDSEEHRKLMGYGPGIARGDRRTDNANNKDPLSKEEYHNLTEYQCKGLYSAYKIADRLRKNADLQDELTGNVMIYEQVRIEREKSNNMLDAQNEAETIMDASVKEAIALLYKDGVDRIDEKEKERKEEAKEAAEKKIEEKKKEEKMEKLQLITEEISKKTVISDTTSLDEAQEAVNSEITNILNKFILVPNDIKGSVVDDQV